MRADRPGARGFFITRRSFCQSALNGSLLAILAAAFYPILRYLKPPPGVEAAQSSVVAAKIGDLKPNSAKIFRFGNRPGLLVHTLEGELKAYSAVCTHLNCTVQYDDASRSIWCACHNGRFDLKGQVISGPPPRPLENYEVNVRGEDVVVTKTG